MQAMKKTMSAILSLVLVFCMLFSTTAVGVFAAENGAEGVFGIDRTSLVLDQTLKVNNPDGFRLQLYVDGKAVEAPELKLTADCCEKWIKVEGYRDEDVVASDTVFFSKLPVLYINTDDGEPIVSKEEYKSGTMSIQNNDTAPNTVYDGAITIKGRGNTTWGMPKKPYRIKLDKKTDLFGMGANKNWVLINNYLDECFLRNTTAAQLSDELGILSMSNVWTDVVLNGEYVGNYLLCEHVRVDPGRVEIYDWEEEAKTLASTINKAEKKKGNVIDKDALEEELKSDLSWVTADVYTFNGTDYEIPDYDISGGYLFELSQEYDELSKFTTNSGLKVMVKSPEYLYTNQGMMDYITEFWQNFEDAYRSEDGYIRTADGKKHYSEIADLDTMVGFWLVQEIVGNNDGNSKSRYAYLDHDEKLKFGPSWDFDFGCGSSAVSGQSIYWKLSKSTNKQSFYKEWLDDPLFIAKATQKYWEIRPFLQSLIEDGGVLDTEISYLTESGIADHAIWDRHEYILPTTQTNLNARGFEADAAFFKAFMTSRIEWLDKQFVSDDSLLLSTYISSTASSRSAYPYLKDNTKLTLSMPNTLNDSVTPAGHAVANGEIPFSTDLNVNIDVHDENTVLCNVYVNGLAYSSVPVTDGKANLVIAANALTEPKAKKNVISVIAKDAQGETTARNFTTVIKNGGVEPTEPPTEAPTEAPTAAPTEAPTLPAEDVIEPDTTDAIAVWSFDAIGKSAGKKLKEYGGADEGYLATAGTGKMTLNVSGEKLRALEWSEAEYGKSGSLMVPLMAAGSKNPWGAPYINLSVPTKGYDNLKLTMYLAGSDKAPASWKLQYSVNGDSFTDVDGKVFTITSDSSKQLTAYFNKSDLPDFAYHWDDDETVDLRLVPVDMTTIDGSNALDVPTVGELALNYVVVQGRKVSYDDVVMGDVDGNGIVDIVDATLLQRYLAWSVSLTSSQLVAADLTHIGNPDSVDVTIIERALAGMPTGYLDLGLEIDPDPDL